jgi:hypothetical protein
MTNNNSHINLISVFLDYQVKNYGHLILKADKLNIIDL